MPRNMSFSLTTDQVRQQTKTVTRRMGWRNVKKGDVINACVKCMGLGRGGKIEKICQIRVVDVRRESLSLTRTEPNACALEGFPDKQPSEFMRLFCDANDCHPDVDVTRIEFEYINPKGGA